MAKNTPPDEAPAQEPPPPVSDEFVAPGCEPFSALTPDWETPLHNPAHPLHHLRDVR